MLLRTDVLTGAAALLSTGILLTATFYAGTPYARTSEPKAAKVNIISPAIGASATSPVTVKFGLSGIGVAPAGVNMSKTGHQHSNHAQ